MNLRTVSENGSAENPRIKSLDVYKGIAILGVLAVHVFVYSTMQDKGGDQSGMPLVLQGLYLGLLGFFAISGYFYRPNRGIRNNLRKRFGILGLAYFSCAIILPMILCAEMAIAGPNTPSFSDYVEALKWVCGSPMLFEPYEDPNSYAMCAGAIGYYYIQIMLVTFLVFYIVADRLLCSWKRMLAACLFLGALQVLIPEVYPNNLPFHSQQLPIGLLFMLLGAYAGRFKLVEKVEYGGWRNRWVLAGLGMCAVICVILTYLFPPGTGFNNCQFGDHGGWSAIPFIFDAAAMIMVEVFICFMISKIPLLSCLISYLGKHTLSLMLLQGFVVKLVLIPFYEIPTDSWFPTVSMATKLLLYAVSIVLPITISNLIVRHLAPFFFKYIGKETGSPF